MEDIRVAIIGAGPSGLAAARHIPGAIVYEAKEDVGGVWLYTPDTYLFLLSHTITQVVSVSL